MLFPYAVAKIARREPPFAALGAVHSYTSGWSTDAVAAVALWPSPMLSGIVGLQPGRLLLRICPSMCSLKVLRGFSSPLTITTNWFGGREGGTGLEFTSAQPEIRAVKAPSNTTLFILAVIIIVIVLSVTEMQPTSILQPSKCMYLLGHALFSKLQGNPGKPQTALGESRIAFIELLEAIQPMIEEVTHTQGNDSAPAKDAVVS